MIAVGIGGTYALSQTLSYVRFEPYIRQFKSLLWENVASYELSVVPLFIFMGYLASQSNLSRDLFRGFEALMKSPPRAASPWLRSAPVRVLEQFAAPLSPPQQRLGRVARCLS